MGKRHRIVLKPAYILCIGIVLALGLMGGSYAYWTDVNFLISTVNTGRLQTALITEKFDTLVINETQIPIYEDGVDDKGNKIKVPKGYEKKIGIGHLCSGGNGHIKHGCIERVNSTIGIVPFIIKNTSTLPIELELEEIFLVRDNEILNISDSSTCNLEYSETSDANSNKLKLNYIVSDIYGYLNIDISSMQIQDFMQSNESCVLQVNLYFSQTNLSYGGWTDSVTIQIPISKNIIIVEDDKDKEKDKNNDKNKDEVISSDEESSLEGGIDDED